MKKLLIGLFISFGSISAFSFEITEMSGCMISVPRAQWVRNFPPGGLSGKVGERLFVAQPEEKYYVLDAGDSRYALFLSMDYLKVMSANDPTKIGYLLYDDDSEDEGLLDFSVYKCGAKYRLTEKR